MVHFAHAAAVSMARAPRARAIVADEDPSHGHWRRTPPAPKPPLFLARYPLLRFLLINMASGIAVALMVTAALLLFDVHGLGNLVQRSDMGAVAVFALAVMMSITFGAAAMATAVMSLGRDRDGK